MDDLERELKLSTIDELEDHLSQLGDLLNNKDYHSYDTEDFDTIFRIVHSIKGNTRACGYEEIATVSHLYESKLIEVREKTSEYSERLHELSLSFFDALNDVHEILKSDIDAHHEFSELISALEQYDSSVANIASAPAKASSKTQMLIVDDDQDIRDIVEEFINEKFDAELSKKENGLEALEASTKDIKYTVIICDYKMPELDGKAFIEKLRSGDSINRSTPIIFLSGYRPDVGSSESTWDNVFFIEKPFTESKLIYYIKCSIELGKNELAA